MCSAVVGVSSAVVEVSVVAVEMSTSGIVEQGDRPPGSSVAARSRTEEVVGAQGDVQSTYAGEVENNIYLSQI